MRPGTTSTITGTPGSEEVFTKVAVRGQRNAMRVGQIVEANELEQKSISALEKLTRHGCRFINFTVRKDGVEHHFEGDWLARLFRADSF